MAMGERLRFFRKLRGMKLKELGRKMGFPEKSADVRMAQYEAETRTPKAELTAALANALEDTYGLRVEEADGEICLGVDASQGARAASLREMLRAWREQAARLEAGEITREEYDRWRYRYPEFDTSGQWHKISPSQGLSDGIVKRGRNRIKREK